MLHAALLALAVSALPTYGPIPAPSDAPLPFPVPTGANEALIVNSGSTNTQGYRIFVRSDGSVSLALALGDGAGAPRRVAKTLVTRFLGDLRAAGNLAKLAGRPCVKSVSFGSSTRVSYRGMTSPDLSCPASVRARALSIDAAAIANGGGGVTSLPMPRRPL